MLFVGREADTINGNNRATISFNTMRKAFGPPFSAGNLEPLIYSQQGGKYFYHHDSAVLELRTFPDFVSTKAFSTWPANFLLHGIIDGVT